MLQLHEVVCQFKYYNAKDVHFSKVVYTYTFFYNKLLSIVYTDV